MDFLPKQHTSKGGIHARHPKTPNLANHGKRQEGKTPPHSNPSQSTKSRQNLSILSNTNTHRRGIACACCLCLFMTRTRHQLSRPTWKYVLRRVSDNVSRTMTTKTMTAFLRPRQLFLCGFDTSLSSIKLYNVLLTQTIDYSLEESSRDRENHEEKKTIFSVFYEDNSKEKKRRR